VIAGRFQAGTSAGFWLGGSMPPCRLRRRKFWKFDYDMVHSEVYLNKYVVSIAPFSTSARPDCSQNITKTQKTAHFCMFSLFNFSSIFPGGHSADPICPYVRTPMVSGGICSEWCRQAPVTTSLTGKTVCYKYSTNELSSSRCLRICRFDVRSGATGRRPAVS